MTAARMLTSAVTAEKFDQVLCILIAAASVVAVWFIIAVVVDEIKQHKQKELQQ